MPEQPSEFWNLDLKRLTWSGWLLMLLTLGALVGVGVAMMFLLEALGVRKETEDNHPRRWFALLILLPALGVACGVFALGRRLLERLGLPIMKAGK
jgi:hypothetical protein